MKLSPGGPWIKLIPRDKPSFARNSRCRAVQPLQVVLEPFLPTEVLGDQIIK